MVTISFRHCASVYSCESTWPAVSPRVHNCSSTSSKSWFSSAEKNERLLDAPVIQIQAAVGQFAGVLVVRHHHDGAALRMQIAQQSEHDALIFGVEVARGLVGQNDLRIVHQRPRNGDALLLAARKLRRQMRRARLPSPPA